MKASRKRVLASLVALALGGCGGVAPKVAYLPVTQPDAKGYIKFQLNRSTLLVDRKKDKDGKDLNEIVLTSVPTDAGEDPVYAMVPDDDLFSTTHLKVVHRANTNLIESLGTEIEDKRVQFIQQVGAVISGVLGVFGATAGQFPTFIDVTRKIDAAQDKRGALTFTGEKLPDGTTTYNMTVGAVTADAIERATFLASIANRSVPVLFYAACRDVRVQFTSGIADTKVFNLRISDPNFVQTIQLPAKGKIEMHTGCGVNVTSEKADVASDTKLINELISQVKTIRDASKKDAAPSSGASGGAKKQDGK